MTILHCLLRDVIRAFRFNIEKFVLKISAFIILKYYNMCFTWKCVFKKLLIQCLFLSIFYQANCNVHTQDSLNPSSKLIRVSCLKYFFEFLINISTPNLTNKKICDPRKPVFIIREPMIENHCLPICKKNYY